jgi:cytochrome c2
MRRQGVLVAAILVRVATLGACSQGQADAAALTHGGDAARGRELIRNYGCGACHAIPGVRGADAAVGPNLSGIASRAYVAGVTPNTPENLIRWLMNPPAIDSQTAMPNLGVSERDARDMAAYLYMLK